MTDTAFNESLDPGDQPHLDASHDTPDTQPEDGGALITAIAGIAAVGVGMAARPVLKSLYRQVTGRAAPDADDPRVPFGRALGWTLLSATTGAIIELVVQRTARRMLASRN